MKTLQRTIFWEVLRVFTLVLTGLTVALVFVGVFREASETGLGPAQLVRIVPFVVPSMLPFTIPATLLMTVCVVYGRVSGDLELTAAKAAGVNPTALLVPTLVLAAGLSAFSFLLTDRIIPWAVDRMTQVAVEAVEDIFLRRLRADRRFEERRLGFDVTVAAVDGRRLIRPVFRYSRDGREPVTLMARWAEFTFDRPNKMIRVTLDTVHMEHPDGTQADFAGAKEIELPLLDERRQPNARDLSIVSIIEELKDHADRARVRDATRDLAAMTALVGGQFEDLAAANAAHKLDERKNRKRVNKLKTERSSRYALSCSCFFFALLGSPFALLRGQTQFLTSFLYCFLPIVGAYYPLMLGLMSQAKSGKVDPAWAMWIGNAGLLAAGVVALRKLLRH